MVGWLALRSWTSHDDDGDAPELAANRASASGSPTATAGPMPSPAQGDPAGVDAGADAMAREDQALADDALGEGPDGDAAASNDDAGATLPDGSAPPEVDGDKPKSVRFGAILVQYRGAQGSKPDARGRDEAKALAEQLATTARDDFTAAVERGDPGSTADAGRMYRGILEPAPEFVLFGLEVDQVADPVDTPRGFLIMKRLAR